MKICMVQTWPVKGDVAQNVAAHERFVALEVDKGAAMVVLPELSLTGYEPTLAAELAMGVDGLQRATVERQFQTWLGAFQKAMKHQSQVMFCAGQLRIHVLGPLRTVMRITAAQAIEFLPDDDRSGLRK